MNADDTYDLHPAKFQEHCQFSCATNCVAVLADNKLIATFKGNHQLFPKRTALFVSVVLFNNLHTTVLLHPLTVFFKFVVVGGCHDVTYLSHNQSVIGLLQIIPEDCRKTSKCKGMKIYRTVNHTILTIMLFYETISSSTCHLQTAIIILL